MIGLIGSIKISNCSYGMVLGYSPDTNLLSEEQSLGEPASQSASGVDSMKNASLNASWYYRRTLIHPRPLNRHNILHLPQAAQKPLNLIKNASSGGDL
jgi:hypothetical protein